MQTRPGRWGRTAGSRSRPGAEGATGCAPGEAASEPIRRERVEDVGPVVRECVEAVQVRLRRIVRHAGERDRVLVAVVLVVAVIVLLIRVAAGDLPTLVDVPDRLQVERLRLRVVEGGDRQRIAEIVLRGDVRLA